MNLRTIALVASLSLNALALWLIDRVQPAAGTARTAMSEARVQASEASNLPSLPQATAAVKKDYAIYRQQLLAAGVPAEIVRAAIRATLEEPRLARQREFYAAAAKQPWWQGGLVAQNITPAQHRELRELQKAEREEVRRVLGPAAYVTDAERERFAFLSAEKAERLAILERDYDEMVRHPPGGAPADSAERQQLLKKEYERDRAALLTPEEQELLAERESNAARSFGFRLEFFPATEAEFRALLQQQKAFDDRFSGIGRGTPEERQLQAEEMRKLNAGIQETLGPERYAKFLLSQRSEYRALVELQRRFAVPQNAFDEVARVQGETMAEGNRIFDDAALSPEQKRAALATLASAARNNVRSALGDDLGQTFLTATGGSWVDLLERGSAYSMQPSGGASMRTLAPPRSTTSSANAPAVAP